MKTPNKGNIYKLPQLGGTVIVDGIRTVNTSKESYEVVDWISFDSENCGGSTRLRNWTEPVECGCTYNDTTGDCDLDPEPGCEMCMGTGIVETERRGFESGSFIARNCKEYIMNAITKPFKF